MCRYEKIIMNNYKYNDDLSKGLRESINNMHEKAKTQGRAQPESVKLDTIFMAILTHRFDLIDDVDRAMFLANMVTDFANGCNVDFSELINRAVKVQPSNVEDKIKKLKKQIAELEDEVREG